MIYIDWNIKCYCDIKQIVSFLSEQADKIQCIIALQEVMPERADYIMQQLGDNYSISYSVDYRKPGAFDTDNRKLGVMILVSKDMEIMDSNVFERCLFPERTLYATIKNGDKIVKVVTLHSITGVSFKMGKAVQFRSFAESIKAYAPNIVSLDANEPQKDHYNISRMEFFDQGDSGKGAKLFFDELAELRLIDAYSIGYDAANYTEGEPLTVSHILPNGTKRRYDFVFLNGEFNVRDVNYLYDESCKASSDHAMIKVEIE